MIRPTDNSLAAMGDVLHKRSMFKELSRSDVLFVSDFGGQAVLLPIAIGVGVVFLLIGWRRVAFAWTIGIGGTFLTTLILKLFFNACGNLLPGHIMTPSGHTAASAAVYGGLLALIARLFTGNPRWSLIASVVVAVVIGMSRVMLRVHTPLEVTVGGVIGICGAMVMTLLAGQPPRHMRIGWIAGVVVAVLLLFHGFHIPSEAAIRKVALHLWPLTECHR